MEKKRKLFAFTAVLVLSRCCFAQEDVEKDSRYISHPDLMASGSDRFSEEGVISYGQLLFDVARDQLFVGARDNLYRLSLRGLKPVEKAQWAAPEEKVSLCQDKGQSENDCHNYIKVLLTDGNRLFTCGTNAFSPQCSWRELRNISQVVEWVHGTAKCPYNPSANITALMTMSGQYYVGSPTDFSGSYPAIYRSLGMASEVGHTLRTNQYDSKWLNEPQFVGSFEDDKFVFFVFRESAVEYINCGKRIYSRIARVCKNDSGGQQMLRDNWTTFVKARLNCSMPGEYPFYYDEVHGIEYLPDKRLLYATFTTPSNSIAGSAICVFNMSSIEEAFRGPFKHQKHTGSAWESHHVDHQQHTHCAKAAKSQQLVDSSLYQLMDQAIQPTTFKPLHTVELERYTELTSAVVNTKHHHETHILFVTTDTGLVKKISILPDTETSCVIEIWKPEMDNAISPIKTIQYLKETDSVYLGTEEAVVRIPAGQCHRHVSRISCLGAQDPMCGWDERREACIRPPSIPWTYWHQDRPACPDTTTPMDGGWSSWSPWEVCLQKEEPSAEEERGEEHQDKCLCQTRHCNNPAPINGGKSCKGISMSVTNCTVHGGWTSWSGWSACSASCGVAVKWRHRTCGAPAPKHGGRVCVGTDRSEIYCTQQPPCPAPIQIVREAGWSEWDAWSACSASCGGGARWRQRRCDSPPPTADGPPCSGCATEAEPCNQQPCETKRVAAWTPWIASPTNNSDGGYVEKRFKFTCRAQTSESIKMGIAKDEERFCTNEGSCGPTPSSGAGWSAWGPWDSCSAECGGGYQTSSRLCQRQHCEGSAKMQRACNTQSCIDGWGCWTDWSPCSNHCGWGHMERHRSCLVPGGCDGDSTQISDCEGRQCESELGWSEWTAWSLCDSDDVQHRKRHCLLKNGEDSESCKGLSSETRICVTNEMENDLHAMAARRPSAVLAAGVIGTGDSSNGNALGIGGTVAIGCVTFIFGVGLTAIILHYANRRKSLRIPSSPHYISQQNSYVSVPLKEVPKKRQPSFSGLRSSTGGLTLKSNNINNDRNNGTLGTPKLYPKAISGDYESATMKRNSNGTCRNNIDLDQEKFY